MLNSGDTFLWEIIYFIETWNQQDFMFKLSRKEDIVLELEVKGSMSPV